jgi:hypothetical protein
MRIIIVGLCTTGMAIVGYGDSPDDILARWGTAFPHLTYLAKSSSGTNRWYFMFINPEFQMPLSVMVPQNCSASEFCIYVATAMEAQTATLEYLHPEKDPTKD